VSELGSREILRLAAGGNDGCSGKNRIGWTGLLRILGVDPLSPAIKVPERDNLPAGTPISSSASAPVGPPVD